MPVIFEAAHQIGLVPIVAILAFGRSLPRSYWLLASAFAVSWIGDSIAGAMDGSWAITYLWLPVQFALAIAAVEAEGEVSPWLLLIAIAGLLSLLISAPEPDLIITIVGSVTLLLLVSGMLMVPVWIYFGAGTLAYFWMLVARPDDVMPAWYLYQACRLLAFATFVGLILYQREGRSWAASRPKSYRGCSSSWLY